jgi:hypothetical protein
MVKRCCASCQNRVFDDKELRCCGLTGKHVRGNKVCDSWVMSDGLKALDGKERGKVQRRRYQLYVLDVRVGELEANARGFDVPPASVESIRRDFEELHGSRYLIK